MLYATTVNPKTSCATIRIGIAPFPGGANATSSVDGPKSAAATIDVGPMPKRPAIRLAPKAATSEPAEPIEKTIPITPAERSSSRTANTRKTAKARLEKRFDVAVQPACARRFGLRRTNRRPSFSSLQSVGFVPSALDRCGASSGLRIPSRNNPEATKLTASTSTA